MKNNNGKIGMLTILIIIALIIIGILSYIAFSNNTSETSSATYNKTAGIYTYSTKIDGNDTKYTLFLRNDGTFIYEYESSIASSGNAGKYNVENNKIILTNIVAISSNDDVIKDSGDTILKIDNDKLIVEDEQHININIDKITLTKSNTDIKSKYPEFNELNKNVK